MATISKGITLKVVTADCYTEDGRIVPMSGMSPIEFTNLLEIPEIGSSDAGFEQIDITTLADSKMKYMNGLESASEPEALEFKFLYDKAQFQKCQNAGWESNYGTWNEGHTSMSAAQWTITLPDGSTCSFVGKSSVRLEGVGVNAALTYILSVTPDSQFGEFKWDFTPAAGGAGA